jgi:hypothetical protein
MFKKNISENKINPLRNDLETNYKILIGEIVIEKLNVEDLYEIVRYGWDKKDLQKMLDEEDYAGIGIIAAWIRECGNGCHGFMIEDDPYVCPLDEDGNYTEDAFGRCC